MHVYIIVCRNDNIAYSKIRSQFFFAPFFIHFWATFFISPGAQKEEEKKELGLLFLCNLSTLGGIIKCPSLPLAQNAKINEELNRKCEMNWGEFRFNTRYCFVSLGKGPKYYLSMCKKRYFALLVVSGGAKKFLLLLHQFLFFPFFGPPKNRKCQSFHPNCGNGKKGGTFGN